MPNRSPSHGMGMRTTMHDDEYIRMYMTMSLNHESIFDIFHPDTTLS
jgi:hypothetical protein